MASIYDVHLRETKLTNSVYNKSTHEYNDVTHHKLYHERYCSDQIFILDWSTTKDNITENRKAELMRIILTKWDFDRCKNVSIVEGGYSALITNCPKILTDPHDKSIPSHAYQHRDEPIGPIEYPYWYFKFNKNDIPPADYISNPLQITEAMFETKKSSRVYNTVIQLYEKLIKMKHNEIKWEKNYIGLTKDFLNNHSSSSTSSDRKLFKCKLTRKFHKLRNITKYKEQIENKIETANYNGIIKLKRHERKIEDLRAFYQSLIKRFNNLQQERCIWEEKVLREFSKFDDNDEEEQKEEEGGEKNSIDANQSQLSNQDQQTTTQVETSLQYPLTTTNFDDVRNSLHDELTNSQTLSDVDAENRKKKLIKQVIRSKLKSKRKASFHKTFRREDLFLSRYENDEVIQQEPGLRGLANIGGKTCYMNCAIQCLDKIDEFKKNILKMKYQEGSVAGEFIKMLEKLNEINQSAFIPHSFKVY